MASLRAASGGLPAIRFVAYITAVTALDTQEAGLNAAVMSIERPATLAEAAQAALLPGSRLVAGGIATVRDLKVARLGGVGALILIDHIPGLDLLFAHPKIGVSIGAMVRLSAVANNLWIAKRWAALHEATEHFLPPQIRNGGTVVGNVCADDPAHDIAPALLALDARLKLVDTSGAQTEHSLSALCRSERDRLLPRGVIAREILLDAPPPDAGSAFRKIDALIEGQERIAVKAASLVTLDPTGERILKATLAIGGCVPRATRIDAVEELLSNAVATDDSFANAGRVAADAVAVAAPARPLVAVLARDVLAQAASRARSRHNPFDDAQHFL